MYLIDGHNLIPNLPGLSLREIDDELALVDLLQTFSRVRRKQVVVYFDGALPGQAGERVIGTVRACFVPTSSTADEAIRRRLKEAGKRARSFSVVSTDRQVQANAREAGAKVIPSEEFARDLLEAGQAASQAPKPAPTQVKMTSGELDEWLDLFGIDPQSAARPIEPPAQKPVQRKRGGRKQRPRHGFEPKNE